MQSASFFQRKLRHRYSGKIRTLRNREKELGLSFDIETDGGINEYTMEEVLGAGANICVIGSAVFNGDISSNVKKIRTIMDA